MMNRMGDGGGGMYAQQPGPFSQHPQHIGMQQSKGSLNETHVNLPKVRAKMSPSTAKSKSHILVCLYRGKSVGVLSGPI